MDGMYSMYVSIMEILKLNHCYVLFLIATS